MEKLNSLALDRTRDFGGNISDVFAFFIKNLKALFFAYMIFVSPFILLVTILFGIGGNSFLSTIVNDNLVPGNEAQTLGTMGIAYLCMFISIFGCIIVFYAAVLAQHKKGPYRLDYEDIKEMILSKGLQLFGSVLITTVIFIIPIFIIGLLFFISPVVGGLVIFVYLFLFIYLSVPLTIFPYVRALESSSVSQGLKRSFYLVKERWWSTFGLFFVLNLISSIVQYIFLIPLYIVIFAVVFSGMGNGSDFYLEQIPIWSLIVFFISFGGMIFVYGLYFIGICYKTHDLIEQKDGHSLVDKIGEIGTQQDSMFENEGDY